MRNPDTATDSALALLMMAMGINVMGRTQKMANSIFFLLKIRNLEREKFVGGASLSLSGLGNLFEF